MFIITQTERKVAIEEEVESLDVSSFLILSLQDLRDIEISIIRRLWTFYLDEDTLDVIAPTRSLYDFTSLVFVFQGADREGNLNTYQARTFRSATSSLKLTEKILISSLSESEAREKVPVSIAAERTYPSL